MSLFSGEAVVFSSLGVVLLHAAAPLVHAAEVALCVGVPHAGAEAVALQGQAVVLRVGVLYAEVVHGLGDRPAAGIGRQGRRGVLQHLQAGQKRQRRIIGDGIARDRDSLKVRQARQGRKVGDGVARNVQLHEVSKAGNHVQIVDAAARKRQLRQSRQVEQSGDILDLAVDQRQALQVRHVLQAVQVRDGSARKFQGRDLLKVLQSHAPVLTRGKRRRDQRRQQQDHPQLPHVPPSSRCLGYQENYAISMPCCQPKRAEVVPLY